MSPKNFSLKTLILRKTKLNNFFLLLSQMDNAHERRWPPGLLTLETRQMNRRQYEQVNKNKQTKTNNKQKQTNKQKQKILILIGVNDFCQQRRFIILILNGRQNVVTILTLTVVKL